MLSLRSMCVMDYGRSIIATAPTLIDICEIAVTCAVQYGTLTFAYYIEAFVIDTTFRELAEEFYILKYPKMIYVVICKLMEPV